MSHTSSPARLPQLVVAAASSRCGCGDTIDRDERAGEADEHGRLRCLRCMAVLQSGGLPPSALVNPVPTAASHAARVAIQAETLLNRMAAARVLGTLTHQLRPLTLTEQTG